MDQTTEKKEYENGGSSVAEQVRVHVRKDRTYLTVKRTFDIIISLSALVVLSPVLVLMGLIIFLDDPKGSPIFTQTRTGKDSKQFQLYKFRSIVVNAEEMPSELIKYNEIGGNMFKIEHDPRITRVGRFIRRTNIDGLPQLLNILKGDMSIVGPWPAAPEELTLYGEKAEEILTARPGITGCWQVHDRSDHMYNSGERQRLELYYVHNQSVALDTRILFETVSVAIHRGAYILEGFAHRLVSSIFSSKTVLVLKNALCFPVLLFAATSVVSEGGTTAKTEQASTLTEPDVVYRFLKRSFDITVSILGLIVLSPMLVLISLLIKLDSPGPVLHRRICVGRNDKPYIMYKFRSMRSNADDLFDLFTSEQMEAYMRGVKIDDDPRITRIGNFLRKTSLDEIPQLFSVVKGDMSLVGPRPVIEREAAEYGEDREKLLSCRAGITGCWQVEGRGTIPFLSEEAKRLQLYYVEHQSLGMDVSLLLKTVKVVLSRKGAK